MWIKRSRLRCRPRRGGFGRSMSPNSRNSSVWVRGQKYVLIILFFFAEKSNWKRSRQCINEFKMKVNRVTLMVSPEIKPQSRGFSIPHTLQYIHEILPHMHVQWSWTANETRTIAAETGTNYGNRDPAQRSVYDDYNRRARLLES